MFDDAFTPEKAAVAPPNGPSSTTEDDGTAPRSRPALILNEIQVLAFAKWVASGRPAGDSLKFWLEAEQQHLRERSKPCDE